MKKNFFKAKIPVVIYIVVFSLIVLAGIFNFVFSKPSEFYENKDLAIKECIKSCQTEVSKGIILSEGPCLSQEIVEGWACDIINQPKIDLIDNNPRNQCESYIKKDVKNIVYVSQKCTLVSAK